MSRFKTLCESILEESHHPFYHNSSTFLPEGGLIEERFFLNTKPDVEEPIPLEKQSPEVKTNGKPVVEVLKENPATFKKDCEQVANLVNDLVAIGARGLEDPSDIKYYRTSYQSVQMDVRYLGATSEVFQSERIKRVYILREGEGGKIIGTGYMKFRTGTNYGEFVNFVVAQNKRGSGIGKFFLNEIIRLEKENHPEIQKILLDAVKGKVSEWYTALGFRTTKTYIPNGYVNEHVRMEKTI